MSQPAPRTPRPAPIKITDRAADQIRSIVDGAEKPVIGVRVGVRQRGCSGHMYDIQYAEEAKPWDEVVEDKGVKVLVDMTALMFIVGSEMDWREDKFSAGFVFNNPNATGTCGCGESFHVG